MPFFRRKGGEEAEAAERVRKLAEKGLSEREIIKKLRSEGWKPDQISKALNQVLKRKVERKLPRPSKPEPKPIRKLKEARKLERERYVPKPPPKPKPREREEIELTEEEEIGLEDLVEEIITDKIASIELRLKKMEKEQAELVDSIKSLRKLAEREKPKIGEKISKEIESLADEMEGIESRTSSMEMAFKDFVPELTKDVRSLSEIVKELKETEKEKET